MLLPRGRTSILILVALFATFLFLGYSAPYLSPDLPYKVHSGSTVPSNLIEPQTPAIPSDATSSPIPEPSSQVVSQASKSPTYFISDKPDRLATLESQEASISPSTSPIPEIPNIVHFVHLVPPPTNGTTHPIQFEFQHFIAVYSVYLYLKPERIYIHTNAAAKQIKIAQFYSPNKWTRLIAKIPKVRFNFESAPQRTTSDRTIEKLAHQSDFVRTRVMKKLGGIYLDEDAYVIRDLVSLRRAGFRNVVGKQVDALVACGMWLSMPESDLVTAYQALQDRTFTGGWTTHSVELLSRLVTEFAGQDREVLILEQDALFPLSWKQSDLNALYQVYNGTKLNETNAVEEARLNMTALLESFELKPAWKWQRNWGHSYALHGYNSELKNAKEAFGEFGGITLPYVLARSSNFARAVYPAVKHAMDNGFDLQENMYT